MNRILFALAIVAAVLTESTAQQVAGKVYSTSGCYSGEDFDFHFFDDSTLIASCKNCGAKPYIRHGKWTISGNELHYHLTREWKGKGLGDPIEQCETDCVYASYTAASGPIDKKGSIDLKVFSEGYESTNCIKILKNEMKSSNPHDALKTAFVGRFPQSSKRPLMTNDFKGLLPNEIKLMRNEIYARYGLIFKTKELSLHFEKQEGYERRLEKVDAFLSEIEQKNVEFIKKYELK